MKQTISIIGGGPSALLLAAFLDTDKFDITIFEKKKSLGRKFLVAGKGGFNLSHAEPIQQFIERYTPSHFLKNALLNFDNNDLRDWLAKIGLPTFVGSSKRIYPQKGIKPIKVLNTILQLLQQKKVHLKYNYEWKGWSDNNELTFNENKIIQSDYTIFAVGGSSWKITGSDGTWVEQFKNKDIQINPFLASNCAFQINWKKDFISKQEGSPLKNIAITCLGKRQKGEVVITKFGLEGNGIYALSPQIRQELKLRGFAEIFIDFKPTLSEENILKKLENSNKSNTSGVLKNTLKLSSAQIALLKSYTTKEDFLNKTILSHKIKNLPLRVKNTAPLDEAISTVGGIDLKEVDENFQLKKIKNHFCIGEMLDWDTPTGGYLLQACFSMGVYLANHLNEK